MTCVTQVVRSTSRNIKSGWKNVFQVLNIAARDESETVVALAFDLVHKIVEEPASFALVTGDASHGHVAYADCVACLAAFARNKHRNDMSLESVRLMTVCTHKTLTLLSQKTLQRAPHAPLTHTTHTTHTASSSESARPSSPVEPTDAAASVVLYTDREEDVRLWFPVLTALGALAADSRANDALRSAALGEHLKAYRLS